jgi:hypothetical protein
MNRIYATGELKAFLDARALGASPERLKKLQSAAEAACEPTAPHGAVKRAGNVIFLPDRISAPQC